MTECTHPDPFLVADHPALDFLNSVCSPSGAEIDWIADGNDLLTWLDQAGLIPAEVAQHFRCNTAPEVLDRIAAQARALRTWFRDFVAAHAGRPLVGAEPAKLDLLNRILGTSSICLQIERSEDATANGVSLELRQRRHWKEPEDLLAPIAQAIAECICDADFEQIKHCEGSACTLWFLDVSKNHTRRWCSMEVCGNRAKAAAHRAKKQAAQSR